MTILLMAAVQPDPVNNTTSSAPRPVTFGSLQPRAELMPEARGLKPRDGRGSVRVGVERQHLAREMLFDEVQRPPRCGPVRIYDAARAAALRSLWRIEW